MKLREITARLNLQVLVGERALNRGVSSGYCSDMISDFMANSTPGWLWLTLQTHMNVIAVAFRTGAAVVILTGEKGIPPEVCRRAEAEGLPLLSTFARTFGVADGCTSC